MPLPPPPPPGSSGAPGPSGPPSISPPPQPSGQSGPSGPPGHLGPLPTPPPAATTTVCYRHGDRPAGRRCTRCGTPACEDCLVQAAVGSQCLACARANRPDVRTRARFWSARQPLLVTTTLIAMNVAVFVAVLVFTRDPGALTGGVTDAHLRFGLSVDVLQQRILWQSSDGLLITEPNGWYRLVTSGFMHFGIIHIAFNMYFLYVLGQMLEPGLGRVPYLLLYAASLLGGSFGVVLMGGAGITAGASGAVFGLLGAATVGLWRRGINPFSTGLGATLVLNLFITFAIPGISIGGHLGGIVAGSICALVMLAPSYKAFPPWATYATPIAVGVASVLGSILIVVA